MQIMWKNEKFSACNAKFLPSNQLRVKFFIFLVKTLISRDFCDSGSGSKITKFPHCTVDASQLAATAVLWKLRKFTRPICDKYFVKAMHLLKKL